MTNNQEKIELTLPVNGAYVSAARLTASSIANRMGFSIDDIEDIKSAVSEACVFIINSKVNSGFFKIAFDLDDDVLDIKLTTVKQTSLSELPEGEMGTLMIKALMDSLDIYEEGNENVINMKKKKG